MTFQEKVADKIEVVLKRKFRDKCDIYRHVLNDMSATSVLTVELRMTKHLPIVKVYVQREYITVFNPRNTRKIVVPYESPNFFEDISDSAAELLDLQLQFL